MKNIGYYYIKAKQVLFRMGKEKRKETLNAWFRRQGIKIGEKCSIFCNIISSEPYLITIGDNVTISNDVQLITHDNSIIKPSSSEYTDIFGEIRIGNNCFIGAHVLILPGVSICNNVIIAAGSVVSKSINEENTVWGGNPIRKLSSWIDYLEKNKEYAFNISRMNYNTKRDYILHNVDRLKKR